MFPVFVRTCVRGQCLRSRTVYTIHEWYPSIFLKNICVQCVTRAVRRVEWCIARSVSLEVVSGSVSDDRKAIQVRRGYVSVQLRWIVRSQELGFVGTRVIAVGFLDPPFWLQLFQFLMASNILSFVNIFLANNYIFHDVQNIVKHSLVISKWSVEI